MSEPEEDRLAMIRSEHDRQRRFLLGVLGLALFLGLAIAGGLILLIVPASEQPVPVWALAVVVLTGAIGTAISGYATVRARADLITDRLRFSESYGDGLQRQRNHALLFMAVPMALFLVSGLPQAWKLASGQGETFNWIAAYLSIFVPITVGLTLAEIGTGKMGRMKRHLDDEMTKLHRKQALSLAFVAMLAGATGTYFLGLHHPAAAVIVIPIVIAGAVQVGALRFVLLEREAERNG